MTAGIYLHIPFCKSRCSYCDFATDVYKSSEAVERYVAALCRELEHFDSQALAGGSDLLIDTVYFGGGTPSLLTPKQVEKILASLHSKFTIDLCLEMTMEMNPATVSLTTLKDYKSLGVNRASFGVQTFDDTELKRLARGHDANDARETFRMLREAGFENVSFDLIAGLPRQTLGDWERNLDEALKLRPEHLSLYLLEIHEGTPLAEQIRSRRQPLPDEEIAAEMYELLLERMPAAGYAQYEVSNFSKPGFESKHNSKYWLLEPVYAFGVSAHSFDGTQRYANERDTAQYVQLIEEKRTSETMRENIDAASEFVFLGLRMTNGIDLAVFENRFGFNLRQKYGRQLETLFESELVEIYEDRLLLTRKGMLFSNEVFSVFV
ncbi:MAG: radical SAM family heme chaperone HemW [Blastocatellia bacterium]|nr:radical SAM family heme chaperone HemW [Blastocatellia bacterium]MDQ3220923.1 radical SAM family heme chaperone HemW [Acidobacteriota bacterium]